METWEFLLQKKDSPAWLPLKNHKVSLSAGTYRLVAQGCAPDIDVEIQVLYQTVEAEAMKRRSQKRSGRTSAEGLIVVVPFTEFKPGLWELRLSSPQLRAQWGEDWQERLQLRVKPREGAVPAPEASRPLADSNGHHKPPLPETNGHQLPIAPEATSPAAASASPAGTSLIPEVLAPETTPAPAEPGEVAHALLEQSIRSLEQILQQVSEPGEPRPWQAAVTPPPDPTQEEPTAPATVPEPVPTPWAAEDWPDLSIALAQETFIRRQEEPILISGQVNSLTPQLPSPLDGGFSGQLRYELRDPQSQDVLLSVEQPLSDATIPLVFNYLLDVPTAYDTRLVLGEVSVEVRDPHQPNLPPIRLAQQNFSITAGLENLLDSVRHISPASLQPEPELRLQLPPTTEPAHVPPVSPRHRPPKRDKAILPPRLTPQPTAKRRSLELPSFGNPPPHKRPQPTSSAESPESPEALATGTAAWSEWPTFLPADLDFGPATAEEMTPEWLAAEVPPDEGHTTESRAWSDPFAEDDPTQATEVDEPLTAEFTPDQADPHGAWGELPTDVLDALPDARIQEIATEAESWAGSPSWLMDATDWPMPRSRPPAAQDVPTAMPSSLANDEPAPSTPTTESPDEPLSHRQGQDLSAIPPLATPPTVPAQPEVMPPPGRDRALRQMNELAERPAGNAYPLPESPAPMRETPSPAVAPLDFDHDWPLQEFVVDDETEEAAEAPLLPSSPPTPTPLRHDASGLPYPSQLQHLPTRPFLPDASRAILPPQTPANALSEQQSALVARGLPPNSTPPAIPAPQLELQSGELTAGDLVLVKVKLPPTPGTVYVKLWVKDCETRQLLDGPRAFVDFDTLATGELETLTQVVVPLGTQAIRFEAITIDVGSQQESHKTSCDRAVIPPDLYKLSLEGLSF